MATATLEDRLAERMGVLNAVTSEVVELIAEALESGAWEGFGIKSPEHWVTWRCGVSPARAKTLVGLARKLARLPAVRAAFTEGALTEDQTRAVCIHTPPRHEEQALEYARMMTVPQLRRTLATLPPDPDPAHDRDADAPEEPESQAPGRRELRFGYRDDGRWWMRVVLSGEEGALMQRALERARDAEFRLRHPGVEVTGEPGTPLPSDIGWPEGLLRLAEAALVELDPGGRRPSERFQVLVHVDADAPATGLLHLGPRLPASVMESIHCDSSMRWVLESAGKLVGLSEKQDTVDDKTRALIEHRDGGCRVPGCPQIRWLHIHHLVHRTDGGPTIPSNLLALCPYHHRLHHAGLLHITGDPTTPDGLVFTRPDGTTIGPSPPRPPSPDTPTPTGTYEPPLGERLELRWVHWNERRAG